MRMARKKIEEKAEIALEEDETPAKRYFVMRSGYLKCKLARGRLESVKSRLEDLRDNRKPKESPEEYAMEVVIMSTHFDRKQTRAKKLNLPLIKTPPIEDVVEAMVSKLYKELKFDAEKGYSKLTED